MNLMGPRQAALWATALGLGFLRPASGTWASAFALLLGLGLWALGGFWALLLAALLATGLGFAACAALLAARPGDDPSEVVIDEIAGQLWALAFPAAAFWAKGAAPALLPWPAWVSAFLLFRLFDIWKPWLVGRADRRGDAAGVMLDDLWAGLFAGLGTLALGVAYHAYFLAPGAAP